MQSQNGLATLELALPHTEKEREGGKERPFDKRTEPSPHLHFFPPCLFPCPVELIWQRGGSISQFTQAAAAFCVLCLLLRSPCLCFHPHSPLCSLCADLFAHVCVYGVCVVLHALSGGIISCTVRWFDPWGWKHLPHTGCAAKVSWHRYRHLSSFPPHFLCGLLPLVPTYPRLSLFLLCLHTVKAFEVHLNKGRSSSWQSSSLSLYLQKPTHRHALVSDENPFCATMHISCAAGKQARIWQNMF